ncbi:MAG: cyclic-phosphate processing receiver domain-containing protein [Pyrinomonadaceae bacterium]
MNERAAERILIVEDDEARCNWFRVQLARRMIDMTCDAAQAVAWLKERDYAVILLDHDLLDEHYLSDAPDDARTGYAVAAYLACHTDCQRDATIVIHSLNYHGAARMLDALRGAGRDAEHIPFPYLISNLRF